MDFDEVVKRRRSVRDFSGKRANWKDVLEAIDAANQGPFAGNHNNLQYIVVENSEKIREIAKQCDQPWVSQTNIMIVVCSDDRDLENIYGERGRVYSRQQAGAAIATILLKLVDAGLSACWVGAYSDELLKRLLQIPAHVQIEAIIPVGYSSEKLGAGEKSGKRELESALFWENWDQRRRPTLFEERKEDYWPEGEKYVA